MNSSIYWVFSWFVNRNVAFRFTHFNNKFRISISFSWLPKIEQYLIQTRKAQNRTHKMKIKKAKEKVQKNVIPTIGKYSLVAFWLNFSDMIIQHRFLSSSSTFKLQRLHGINVVIIMVIIFVLLRSLILFCFFLK